jgi:ABC-type glycerol-3-phosphate transport system permease component
VLVLAITIAPMLYMIVGGFSTTAQLNANPSTLPHPWVWDNYATILTSSLFWQAVANSVLIALVATGLAMTLGSMAAFALSRYTFRGREAFYLLFVAGLLFPLNTAALPLAVASFQSTYTQDTARVYAFTAVSMIPALAIFIFAQRKLVGGLAGAIRG